MQNPKVENNHTVMVDAGQSRRSLAEIAADFGKVAQELYLHPECPPLVSDGLIELFESVYCEFSYEIEVQYERDFCALVMAGLKYRSLRPAA